MTTKIKAILALIGAVAVCVIIGIVLYANGQRDKYLQAKGASEVLTAEFASYKASAEPLISGLNQAINGLTIERDKAKAKADEADAAKSAIQAKYDKLKSETASLPATALTSAINARIGLNESWPTAGGLFAFSRVGTERTLNLFLDGEGYAAKYEQERAVSVNLRVALDAAERGAALWSEKYALRDGEYQRAIAAWGADKDALVHLRRSLLGRKVKSFIVGAAIGAGAVIIYNAVSKEP